MIELFEQNERMQDRQSSKGNQLKWENAGIWYKADVDELLEQAMGYSDEVKERVQTLLHRQIDKYAYLIHTS